MLYNMTQEHTAWNITVLYDMVHNSVAIIEIKHVMYHGFY